MTPAFDRGTAPNPDEECPFCLIAASFPPFDPRQPPTSSPDATRDQHPLDPGRVSPPAYVVLSTPTLMAFLDILPLSRGHLLLCPRAHRPKLTDTTAAESAELGRYLRVLSAALAQSTGVVDWNVVQNNGAAAAQVVPHMHFHLIPRPEIRAAGRYSESFTMFGRGRREELDDQDAETLANQLRASIVDIITADKANL